MKQLQECLKSAATGCSRDVARCLVEYSILRHRVYREKGKGGKNKLVVVNSASSAPSDEFCCDTELTKTAEVRA